MRMIRELMLCFMFLMMDAITGGKLQVVVMFSISKTFEQRTLHVRPVTVLILSSAHIYERAFSAGKSSQVGMIDCLL